MPESLCLSVPELPDLSVLASFAALDIRGVSDSMDMLYQIPDEHPYTVGT